MPVMSVEACLPATILLLALANDAVAVRVDSLHTAVNKLFHHLRVAGRILAIDEVFGGHPAYCLRHAVAIAIVNDFRRAAVDSLKAVFVVVRIRNAVGRRVIVESCV